MRWPPLPPELIPDATAIEHFSKRGCGLSDDGNMLSRPRARLRSWPRVQRNLGHARMVQSSIQPAHRAAIRDPRLAESGVMAVRGHMRTISNMRLNRRVTIRVGVPPHALASHGYDGASMRTSSGVRSARSPRQDGWRRRRSGVMVR